MNAIGCVTKETAAHTHDNVSEKLYFTKSPLEPSPFGAIAPTFADSYPFGCSSCGRRELGCICPFLRGSGSSWRGAIFYYNKDYKGTIHLEALFKCDTLTKIYIKSNYSEYNNFLSLEYGLKTISFHNCTWPKVLV